MVKKLVLDVNEELWKEVKKFKIDQDLKNNSEAVAKLIEKGLKSKKNLNKDD